MVIQKNVFINIPLILRFFTTIINILVQICPIFPWYVWHKRQTKIPHF